jgi:hypothetical protein
MFEHSVGRIALLLPRDRMSSRFNLACIVHRSSDAELDLDRRLVPARGPINFGKSMHGPLQD